MVPSQSLKDAPSSAAGISYSSWPRAGEQQDLFKVELLEFDFYFPVKSRLAGVGIVV